MKILIIGGTRLLGKHFVSACLKRNHSVTLFNRGRESSDSIPGVEVIHGNRNFDLDKLANKGFDAVIDTCGYLPESVRISAEALKDGVGRYIFISSISVYADFSKPNLDESAPLAKLTEEQKTELEKIDIRNNPMAFDLGEMYGPLKALCEETLESIMPGKVLNIRSGLIVGKHDYADRLTYWVERIAKGGEVLAPGNPGRFVQFIDAWDIAEWAIEMAGKNVAGTFNVTGKPNELTMKSVLDCIKETVKSDARFTWVSEEFLEKEKVAPWGEMPLYLPESDKSVAGFLSANIDKALSNGLKLRPLEDTARDIFEWRNGSKEELKAGIPMERESELLRKWHGS